MSTANEDYRDAALRNLVDLRRYSAGLVTRIERLLALADSELAELLNAKLPRFEGKQLELNFNSEEWRTLIFRIRDDRAAVMKELKAIVNPELPELAKLEAGRELATLASALPVEIGLQVVSLDQLRAIVSSRPFHGRLLRDWFQNLEAVDRGRITQALQIGMYQGEPTPQIVRRLIGTKAAGYSDGILSATRRDATAIVRTATNHVSNVARSYVWDANADIILVKVWTSTLDGRTSAICRARDGHAVPVGGRALPPEVPALVPATATPPAHINCRSTFLAVVSPEGLIGNRPFVVDTRTPDKRRVDFRKEARGTGKTEKQVRDAWNAQNIGRVPATTTYQDFLTRQSKSFQDEVLGPTRGKLFRTGKIKLDEYVDRRGNELTLSQLAQRKPEAFRAAGLALPPP